MTARKKAASPNSGGGAAPSGLPPSDPPRPRPGFLAVMIGVTIVWVSTLVYLALQQLGRG